jgi:hypothetical protein
MRGSPRAATVLLNSSSAIASADAPIENKDPTSTKFEALMDGLGFRGVIEKEHTFVGVRDRAGLGHPLAATDNAGNRCRVVGSLYGGRVINSSARLKPACGGGASLRIRSL